MADSPPQEVLLIEDSPSDRYLIHKALAVYGPALRVSVVLTGNQALAFLRHEAPFTQAPCPALILLDLSLPHLSGIEVLAEVRRLPAYRTTPVVVFSSASREVEEQRCRQLGATAYVQKSPDLYEFFAALRAIVEQWLKPLAG